MGVRECTEERETVGVTNGEAEEPPAAPLQLDTEGHPVGLGVLDGGRVWEVERVAREEEEAELLKEALVEAERDSLEGEGELVHEGEREGRPEALEEREVDTVAL